MANSSVKEYTDGKRLSLSYDPDMVYSDDCVADIRKKLNAASAKAKPIAINKNFDDEVESALMDFQRNNDLTPTGVYDDATHNKLNGKAQEVMTKSIDRNNESEEYQDAADTLVPHYDPFFVQGSAKPVRRAHKDIKISFGDGQICKVIKDVYMRSIGVTVDTSGNPISEVYEFIARDMKEIEVDEDKNKYIGEEEKLSSPSDVKYNFNMVKRSD